MSESVGLAITVVAVTLLTSVALLPAIGWAVFLGVGRWMRRQNIVAGISSALLGVYVGMICFYDPLGPGPNAPVYGLAGAWVGGSLGVIVITLLRIMESPKSFRLQRSLRSWFVVLTLICLALALGVLVFQERRH